MTRYAVVNKQTNIVENIVVWDGSTTWTLPDNYFAVQSDNFQIDDIYSVEE